LTSIRRFGEDTLITDEEIEVLAGMIEEKKKEFADFMNIVGEPALSYGFYKQELRKLTAAKQNNGSVKSSMKE